VHNSNKGGMKPVRLLRQEHKERIMQVNTDSPRTSTGEKVDTDTRARVEPKLRPFVGVWEDVKPTTIKSEPEDEEPAPRVFKPVATLDDAAEPEEKVVPEPKIREKKKPKVPQAPWLDPPFVIQTEDDQKEWDRILEDRRILKEELVRKKPDADGDVDMTSETPADKKDGRLYLFQIPPGMPKLYNPKKEPKPEFIVPRHPDDVRSERDAKAKTSRARRINGATSGPSAAPHIKEEEVVIDAKKDEPAKKKGKEPLATMPGYVGKLVIRQSGRAELDWGGSRMLVKRGIQRSFYQMGVLVDSKGCFDGAGNNTGEGTATSLGQIMGNFVVTPDWQSMVADMEREERRIEREEEREFEREEHRKERELQKKIEEEKQLEKDKLLAESIRQREIGKGKGREVVMSDV
jgi:DNA-directed RNA polymerase III subunit RPC4